MTSLGLAIALALASPPPASTSPPTWWGGRVYTSESLHVGVRPAAYADNEGLRGRLEVGAGATLQVTVSVRPWL